MAQIGQPMPKGSSVGVVTPVISATAPNSSYVEWGAVWAGSSLAAALSFILLTFGAATGLSFVSPWHDTVASTTIVGSLALFFAMAQQIGTAMAGGYVAGRMRSRWDESTEDEVEFRDGLHGGLVWAVSVIITAALLFSVAGAIGSAGTKIAAGAASAATTAAASANPLDYTIDVLLRPAPSAPAATAGAAASSGAAAKPAVQDAVNGSSPNSEMRSAVMRTVMNAIAVGKLEVQDRAYLSQVVARETGLSEADAEKRISDVYTTASRTAKDAADKVRRASILTGFVTAASLLIALGAAWWAAQRGGHHRDNSVPARFVSSGARRVT